MGQNGTFGPNSWASAKANALEIWIFKNEDLHVKIE
jgi:hypothetical protein